MVFLCTGALVCWTTGALVLSCVQCGANLGLRNTGGSASRCHLGPRVHTSNLHTAALLHTVALLHTGAQLHTTNLHTAALLHSCTLNTALIMQITVHSTQ